tara:strand:- start:62 stop:490 length:429 start_codon:yes stop_codon:yes gene_type:complete
LVIKITSFFLLLIFACTKDNIQVNPNLRNIDFNISINLNLPYYDNLRFTGGSALLSQGGINGVLLFNLNGSYLAWEASCPNHAIRSCSKLTIKGVLAECRCEGNQYSLAIGQLIKNGENILNPYPMLSYKVRHSENILFISN